MVSSRYYFIFALLVLSSAVRAQIVECVDANGKKTYAQTCPAGAEKKRDIDVPAPVKPGVSNDAAKNALQLKEKAFEQRRAERQSAESAAEEKEVRRNQAEQQCATARQRLDVLEAGRQYKRADPATGEHVPMEEGQRRAEIDRLHEQIQSTCQ